MEAACVAGSWWGETVAECPAARVDVQARSGDKWSTICSRPVNLSLCEQQLQQTNRSVSCAELRGARAILSNASILLVGDSTMENLAFFLWRHFGLRGGCKKAGAHGQCFVSSRASPCDITHLSRTDCDAKCVGACSADSDEIWTRTWK